MPRSVTGLDRAAEAAAQRAMIDAIADAHADRFRAEISRASLDMVGSFEATNALPAMPLEFEGRLAGVWEDLALTCARAFGIRILDQGKAIGALDHKDLSGFAELFRKVARDFIGLEAVRRRITRVAETTRERIIGGVQSGWNEGLGQAGIGAAIRRQEPGLSTFRANLIARTETHGAANHGADAAARATGLDLQKEWVSSHDHRTRRFDKRRPDKFDHWAMDGQVVGMDQPFIMAQLGAEPVHCMFPGDTTLPPGASINCRCAVSHIVLGLD